MSWVSDRKRGNRHQRGYGSQWERLREHILRRDHYVCQLCKEAGQLTPLVTGNPSHPRAAHVDHIKPKAHGGTDDPDNLQSLCRTCHDAKTAREHGVRVVGCDEDGWPVG